MSETHTWEPGTMHEHDGYAPHSHEVRPDHGGVEQVRPQHQHSPCDIHGKCLQCEGCDECERWAENAAEIDRLAEALASHVITAQHALNEAGRDLASLMSNHVYDVELVETAEGDDAKAELESALRAVRNVRRILALRDVTIKGR